MKYTPEQTQELQNLYQAGSPVSELAQRYGVPERSIIAKLSSLGIYQKKQYVSKTGEPPIKKETLVEELARVLAVDILLLDSLEKCNKRVLKILLDRLG
jgi:Zn-dependent peptidase ImmA (M78 family)